MYVAQPLSIDRKEAIQLFLTQRNLNQVQKFSSNINLRKVKEKETTPYQAYFKTNHDIQHLHQILKSPALWKYCLKISA